MIQTAESPVASAVYRLMTTATSLTKAHKTFNFSETLYSLAGIHEANLLIPTDGADPADSRWGDALP